MDMFLDRKIREEEIADTRQWIISGIKMASSYASAQATSEDNSPGEVISAALAGFAYGLESHR